MIKNLDKKADKKPAKNGADAILNRIARIEGQLRGVRRMIDEKKECLDIITQVTAIREAVSMLGIEMLKNDFACKWKSKRPNGIDEKYLKNLFKMK